MHHQLLHLDHGVGRYTGPRDVRRHTSSYIYQNLEEGKALFPRNALLPLKLRSRFHRR